MHLDLPGSLSSKGKRLIQAAEKVSARRARLYRLLKTSVFYQGTTLRRAAH
jgi:hypothetical protein